MGRSSEAERPEVPLLIDKRILSCPHLPLLVAGALLLIYLSPYLVLGQDAHVLIHDNLESSPIATARAVKQAGVAMGGLDATVPQFMDGAPRVCFPSELFLPASLYFLLPPFMAYVTNLILIHASAFISAFLLFRRLSPADSHHGPQHWLISGAALCFALLPHLPAAGLSVPLSPLAVLTFLRIREGGRWFDWALLCAIPFFVSLVFLYLFLLAVVGIAWALDCLLSKRFAGRVLAALGCMSAAFVVVEYRLFYETFIARSFVSHRSEFASRPPSWGRAAAESLENAVQGQYHAASGQWPILLATVLLALFAWHWLRRRDPDKRRDLDDLGRRLSLTLVAILVIALVYGLHSSPPIDWLRTSSPLNRINTSRFHWLQPLLWAVAFLFAARLLCRSHSAGKIVAALAIALQVGLLGYESDFLRGRRAAHPTFREFYAEEQFARIRADLGGDPAAFPVVSLGLHPAVAAYNGFYVRDHYLGSYPLEYKHEFRKVIAPELERSETIREYFDPWGSRCYLMSAELGRRFDMLWWRFGRVSRVHFDMTALRSLGVEYLLSAVRILDERGSQVRLVRVYEDPRSAWRIHLYEIATPARADSKHERD